MHGGSACTYLPPPPHSLNLPPHHRKTGGNTRLCSSCWAQRKEWLMGITSKTHTKKRKPAADTKVAVPKKKVKVATTNSKVTKKKAAKPSPHSPQKPQAGAKAKKKSNITPPAPKKAKTLSKKSNVTPPAPKKTKAVSKRAQKFKACFLFDV